MIVGINKICKKCSKEKDLSEFVKRTDGKSKDGYRNTCKECKTAYNSQYWKLTKEVQLKHHKEWIKHNRDRINENSRKNWQKKKNVVNARRKLRKDANRQQYRDYANNYYHNHKEKHAESIRKRRRENPHLRARSNMSKQLSNILKENGLVKNESILNFFGCSLEEFKKHIESQFYSIIKTDEQIIEMTWDNYGHLWQIDHKKACWQFNLIDKEEQKRCFHYSNLQPLFIKDHKKKTVIDTQEYRNWKQSGLPLEIYLDPIKREEALNSYNSFI